MTNENSIIKMIPMWIILIAVLVLTFWSVKQLAVSIAKTTAQKPEMTANANPYGGGMGMGYNGGYNNYCLIPPMYPPLSNSMMPGTTMTKEDQAALDKYTKETEKYNADYATACKADQDKQEKSKAKEGSVTWMGSVAVYSILTLFGIFSTALMLMVIKKSEKEV